MKHQILSYFYNAVLEYYLLHGVKYEVHQVQRKQDMFKMSVIDTNSSMQALWPLVNCVVNQRLLQAMQRMQQTATVHQCHQLWSHTHIVE